MSRAIIYSFYNTGEEPLDSPVFVMLKNSVNTLRKYNKKIPVIVYISPNKNLHLYKKELPKDVTIVMHQPFVDDKMRYEDMIRIRHKWYNIFRTLSSFSEVYFTDGDTVFYDDPEKIFEKYKEKTKVYCKAFPLYNDFYDFFKIDNLTMNDGQVLIRDYFLKDKDLFLNKQMDYMVEKAKELESMNLSEHKYQERYGWINWAGAQYGISEYLHKINALETFDPHDIKTFPELGNEISDENLISLHYFSYNFYKMLPKELLDLIPNNHIEYAKNIHKEWTWNV